MLHNLRYSCTMRSMITKTTTQVARSIGQIAIDVQNEPVTMTQGRKRKPVAVMVAYGDFQRLWSAAEKIENDLGGQRCYGCTDGAVMWSVPLSTGSALGPGRFPSCSAHWEG